MCECDAILNRVERWWNATQGTSRLAILTPYNLQVKLLKDQFEARFGESPVSHQVEILNTHQAQGLEWDTVFFSVADGPLPQNNPYFTDTDLPAGLQVVNTTLSRAKKHLRIFLDQQYWGERNIGLLSEVARRY
ncbi:MAG: AAA domain-containing protein [Verrucomicrobiales bacterium]